MGGEINIEELKTAHLRTACFTGHRSLPKNQLTLIDAAVEKEILVLVDKGITTFLCGGAVGFDMLAAEKVISLRDNLSIPIKLKMVFPYEGHDLKWNEADKVRLENVYNKANEHIWILKTYHKHCYQARNNFLVTESGVCIAFMTRKRSGAGQTVRLAREKGLTVINLAEKLNEGR